MTRREELATKLNLHIALVAVLLLFDLVIATRLLVAWHESHSDQSAQYQADQATYAQLQARSARLRALPAELATSDRRVQEFVAARIPSDNSAILEELGALKTANHVNLSQAHYSLRPAIPGLVEVQVDAALSGPYIAIMHFINGLERDRDQAFFTIRAITLSDQQGGLVNLRLVLTTYMRADAATDRALQPSDRAATQGDQ